MRDEHKEWLGIKPADFVVYPAGATIVWMYLSRNWAFDIALSAASIALCLLACLIGMRRDAGLSGFNNGIKRAWPTPHVCSPPLLASTSISLNGTAKPTLSRFQDSMDTADPAHA